MSDRSRPWDRIPSIAPIILKFWVSSIPFKWIVLSSRFEGWLCQVTRPSREGILPTSLNPTEVLSAASDRSKSSSASPTSSHLGFRDRCRDQNLHRWGLVFHRSRFFLCLARSRQVYRKFSLRIDWSDTAIINFSCFLVIAFLVTNLVFKETLQKQR